MVHAGGDMRIFITGAAGFIGMHVAARMLAQGHEVVGLDAFTPYYDPALKRARWARLSTHARFRGVEGALEDAALLSRVVEEAAPDAIIHLAAQAGVRYSLEAPRSYIDANVIGTFTLLEAIMRCRVGFLRAASRPRVKSPRGIS
jgi:UDP-glucuronate 4-epimerase